MFFFKNIFIYFFPNPTYFKIRLMLILSRFLGRLSELHNGTRLWIVRWFFKLFVKFYATLFYHVALNRIWTHCEHSLYQTQISNLCGVDTFPSSYSISRFSPGKQDFSRVKENNSVLICTTRLCQSTRWLSTAQDWLKVTNSCLQQQNEYRLIMKKRVKAEEKNTQ